MTLTIRLVPVALFIAIPAIAQDTPRDLRDLVGARAGQAEGQLQRRGYRNVGGEKGDDRSYTNWWNADRRQCVTIATMQGRYDSITTTPAPDCGRNEARDDRRRPNRPSYGYMPTGGDPSSICKGQAAQSFDRRPSEITTVGPIRTRDGTTVRGWFDTGGRSTFFTCRFDADDRFLSVN